MNVRQEEKIIVFINKCFNRNIRNTQNFQILEARKADHTQIKSEYLNEDDEHDEAVSDSGTDSLSEQMVSKNLGQIFKMSHG